jgi:protein TonB
LGRLGIALVLSVAVHALLVARPIEFGVPAFGPLQRPALRATLEPLPTSQATAAREFAPVAMPAADAAGPNMPVAAIPSTAETAALPAAEPASGLPDVTYYPAAELDVYPVPLSPISLGYPDTARELGVPVVTRIWLSIDETGWPTQAEMLDAPPAHVLEQAAVAALRTQRFSPARKDGRAVRSRVLIELELTPAAN